MFVTLSNATVSVAFFLQFQRGLHLIIAEASSISSKKQIIDIALNNMPSYRSRNSYGNNAAKDIVSKIDYSYSSLVFSQVKLFVADRYIYARDAADILAKTSATEQNDVGVYLTEHLADVNNVNLLLNVVSYSSAKDNIIKAASSKATSNH